TMLKRTIGGALFLIGVLAIIGMAGTAPANRPPDQAERPDNRFVDYTFCVSIMIIGIWIRRAGAERPDHSLRRRRWDTEVGLPVARVVERGRTSRDEEWNDEDSEPSLRGNTDRCKPCGYRPVAFDAHYCPACAARNPNPGIVNRIVGPALLIG